MSPCPLFAGSSRLRAVAPARGKPRRFFLFCTTALVAAFSAAGPAMAQTTTIDGGATETVDGSDPGLGTQASPWMLPGALRLGDVGNGTLIVRNGGEVANTTAVIADSVGSMGAATVAGAGSSWDNSNLLAVGSLGTGTLTVSEGGAVSSALGSIGGASGATGTATVAGAGSTWENTDSLTVGLNGTGTLIVRDGGEVSNDFSFIGSGAGSTGSVTVDNAAWVNADGVTIGASGTGTLTVEGGGDVSSSGGTIGLTADAIGAVTVAGAGSRWMNSDFLTVGSAGTGTLTVSEGGDVSNTIGTIGGNAGATGTVTVAGAGSRWVNSDSLVVGFGGAGTLTVADGGMVRVEGADGLTIARNAASRGVVNIGAGAGETAAGAGTLDVARVEFGAGEGALVFNHTDTDYTFTADVAGAGAIEHHAGVTTATGALAHTGGTTIHGGEMIVNGSIGAVDVFGGALGGEGEIAALRLRDGGVLAPGASIGTMTVAGDAVFETGSTLEVEVDSDGRSDLLAVTGAATIETGADLLVLPENRTDDGGTYNESTSYTILTADGGLVGRFDTVTEEFAFLDAEVVYGANDATLILNRNAIPFANMGVTRNQIAAAGAIESLGAGAALYDVVVGLGAADARRAYDALSGEIHASVSGLMVDDARYVREAALARARRAAAEGASNTDESAGGRVAVWTEVYAARGEWDGDVNAGTLERGGGGIFAGADIALPWALSWARGARVGLLGGYSRSDADVDARRSSADIDSYHLGAYGAARTGVIDWRVGMTRAWHDVETERGVIIDGFNAFTDAPRAAYDASLTQFFAEIGHSFAVMGATFEPYGGIAYVDLNTDGFIETGVAARLSAADAGTNTVYTTLGGRGARALTLAGLEARLEGGLAWRHAFDDISGRADVAFATGGETFTVAGVPIARDAALVDFGLALPIAGQRGAAGVFYTGQFSGDVTDNGVRAQIGFRF